MLHKSLEDFIRLTANNRQAVFIKGRDAGNAELSGSLPVSVNCFTERSLLDYLARQIAVQIQI